MRISWLAGLAVAWACVSFPAAGVARGVQETASGPRIVLSETDHDVGRLAPKATASFDVTVRNAGDRPLEIRKVRTSCTCLSAELKSATVAPQTETRLRLQAVALSFEESINEEVLIYSNDPASALQKVRVTGSIGTTIRVLPTAAIGVGVTSRTAVAESRFPGVRLVSSDKSPLQGIRLIPSDPWIKPEARKLEDGTYEVAVTIDPKVPLGGLNGSVRVEAEPPDTRAVDIPVVGIIVGEFDEYGRRVDFGFVKEGQPAAVTFRLKKFGTRDTRIVRAEARLSIPVDVEVTPEIGGGLKLILRIASPPAFTPLQGQLELQTDNPDIPLIRIPVAGGVLARRPFEQAAAEGTDERFLAIIKDALTRGDRIPSDRFFSDVLGGVKDERASRLLLRALAEGDLKTRMRAVELLGELNYPEVAERLRLAITDDAEEFVRVKAIPSYVGLAGKAAVATLLLSLNDDFPWVREESANYLAKVGDASVIPALRAALQDPDPEAAAAVGAALSVLQASAKQSGNGIEKQ